MFDEALDISREAITSSNRLSMNRLSMNRLSMNSLSMRRLSSDGINLAATDLLLDEEGRELLRYTVACALPEGQALVGTTGSITYTFNGRIGLAPDWLEEALSERDQRWITACLLAHVNGQGVEVPISLRGSNRALATSSEERDVYPHEETSFFGNVFQPVDSEDELGDTGNRMYSCGGASLQQACDAGSFAPARTCAPGSTCALQFLGACRDTTLEEADVCFRVTSEGYAQCHTADRSSLGTRVRGSVYSEVITVYLQQSDFSSFYPSCLTLP